ncbi:MAG: 3-keto-5-aminohexanoate cleavage protein, partial [Alphaproteobacteria bacterium]|nr:3-keto-5-aminohexanoate cleavage protein [Alphaproteobacteria bacterium]
MPAKREKVIITCAVTGSIHTPTMSPYLPITPDEVARDAIAAATPPARPGPCRPRPRRSPCGAARRRGLRSRAAA